MVGTVLLAASMPLLSGCGSPPGQLSVTLATVGTSSALIPGDNPEFTVTVVNKGPGSASGISVHVDLPSGLRYKDTSSITGPDAARTQPLDAQVNSVSPVWGQWTMAAPTTNADGTPHQPTLTITFSVDVGGSPGGFKISAHAVGDSSEGQSDAAPLDVQVGAAPSMSMTLSASPSSVKPGGTVTYRATITNSGSGNATSVSLLVTLPPVFQFVKSDTPFQGNSSRDNAVDPIRGTLEVFYGGFTVPAASASAPGQLVVLFDAECVKGAISSSFTADAQLNWVVSPANPNDPNEAPKGDLLRIDNAAAVTVSS